MSLPASLSYEKAKELAQSPDEYIRLQLAVREDIKAEILYYFASDEDTEVRKAIAANPQTPPQADYLLADDKEVEVRVGLGEKIAKLAPGLTSSEQDSVHEMIFKTLEKLASDQETAVRKIISETLKDVATAPHEIISQLARDEELTVCGPVLEYSPVLEDDEILDIIADHPVHGALTAISKRSTVGDKVSDAIARSNDSDAIAAMLANPSTQIQEEALDAILDKASQHPSWHEPLVKRPVLPEMAFGRLARLVASKLIEQLMDRDDISDNAVSHVRAVVEERIESGELQANLIDELPGSSKEKTPEEQDDDEDERTAKAQALHDKGKLNDGAICREIRRGNGNFPVAALSVLINAPYVVIKKAFDLGDTKGIVALSWKAGLKMSTAYEMQKNLKGPALKKIVEPSADGDYPLDEDDMLWQLGFFDLD